VLSVALLLFELLGRVVVCVGRRGGWGGGGGVEVQN